MSDQDITIEIKTVADTTGAENVQQAIKKVEATSKNTQHDLDVLEAKTRHLTQLADKGTTIEIKTVADTTGAEKVEEAIKKVEATVANTQRDLDVLEAKRRQQSRADIASGGGGVTAGGKGIHVASDTAAVQAAAEISGHGNIVTKAISMMGAETSAVAAAAALEVGISAAAIVASFAGPLAAFKAELDSLKEAKSLAAAAGIKLGDELELEMAGLEATLAPFMSAVDTVKEKWKSFTGFLSHPIDTVSGIGALKESLKQAAEQAKKLDELRLQIANGTQADLSGVYNEELAALKEQEKTVDRISKIRSAMGSLAMQGAQQEVESAKLRGGDVELAEANALAIRLSTQLEGLGEKLRAAQSQANVAQSEYDKAYSLYNRALTDNVNKLDPKQFAELDKNLNAANSRLNDANQVVTEQAQLFQAGKTNILRGTENELLKLDVETSANISKEAEKARDGIYQTIKDELGNGPEAAKQAIGAISADVASVKTAAEEKSTEVAAAVETAKAGMVESVRGLGTTVSASVAETEKAISLVGSQLREAMNRQKDAVISALAIVSGTCNANAEEIRAMKSQLEQLHAAGNW